jgi:hypothetical protein
MTTAQKYDLPQDASDFRLLILLGKRLAPKVTAYVLGIFTMAGIPDAPQGPPPPTQSDYYAHGYAIGLDDGRAQVLGDLERMDQDAPIGLVLPALRDVPR